MLKRESQHETHMSSQKELALTEAQALIATLKMRFESHPQRHPGIAWQEVATRITAFLSGNPSQKQKLWSLAEMERTGGEPDVVGTDESSGEFLICDCSAETPKDRRSLCYDRAGLDSRKDFKPETSALEMAEAMGIEMLTESQYRSLQQLGSFDAKTSSWIITPPSVRTLGGALFADFRYGQVFVYHNGAGSYYAVRGFRGMLKL
jgi:hypothetical protein